MQGWKPSLPASEAIGATAWERGHLALAEDRMSSFPALFTEILLRLAGRPMFKLLSTADRPVPLPDFGSVLGNNHESLLGGASDQGNGQSGRPTIEGDPEPRSKADVLKELSKLAYDRRAGM